MDWAPLGVPISVASGLVRVTSLLCFIEIALERVAKTAFSSVF